MPKVDLDKVPFRTGSGYPEPYASQMAGRSSRRLAAFAGLSQFAANIVYLEPGAVASLRHWHLNEDEFAIVLTGELVLAEDTGETLMQPGDCAAWKAGEPVGHRFVNRTDAPASFLVVGPHSTEEVVTYTEVDLKMIIEGGKPRVTHHDGSEWREPRSLTPQGGNQ